MHYLIWVILRSFIIPLLFFLFHYVFTWVWRASLIIGVIKRRDFFCCPCNCNLLLRKLYLQPPSRSRPPTHVSVESPRSMQSSTGLGSWTLIKWYIEVKLNVGARILLFSINSTLELDNVFHNCKWGSITYMYIYYTWHITLPWLTLFVVTIHGEVCTQLE